MRTPIRDEVAKFVSVDIPIQSTKETP